MAKFHSLQVTYFEKITADNSQLRPFYTKRQWLIWSISINASIKYDQLGI